MRNAPLYCFLVLLTAAATAADLAPPRGLRSHTPNAVALVGGKVVVAPGRTIESATVVLRDGRIESVQQDADVPPGVRRVDLSGKTVYAGFIDSYTARTIAGDAPGPGYWNSQVTPQRRLSNSYKADGSLNKTLRGQGFGAMLAAPRDGIIKGQSALVLTGDDAAAAAVVQPSAAQHVRLDIPFGRRSGYPNSPMGAVALARQAMYDAQWFAKATAVVAADPSVERPDASLALQELGRYLDAGGLVLMDAPNELYATRNDRFAREFSLRVAMVGSGNEYRRLEEWRKARRTVIVPLDFPKPPEVASPEAAADASLESLMHWRLAPENPGRLAAAGVTIALTTDGLKNRGDFLKQLRKAIERGLSADDALRALTTVPAEMFGVGKQLGTVEAGKIANLVVVDGDLFQKGKIVATWVNGKPYEMKSKPVADFTGKWALTTAKAIGKTKKWQLTISGKPEKPSAKIGPVRKPKKKAKPKSAKDEAPAKNSEEEAKEDKPEPPAEPPAKVEVPETTERTVLKGADPAESLAGDQTTVKADDKPDGPSPKEDEKKDEKKKPKSSASQSLKPLKVAGYSLTGAFAGKEFGQHGKLTVSATLIPNEDERLLTGTIRLADGKAIPFTAKLAGDDSKEGEKKQGDKKSDDKKNKDAKEKSKFVVEVNYPLGAYGLTQQPKQQSVAFTNATVWTCGPEGKIEGATVVIHDGKIAAVGRDVPITKGLKVINCRGKHLTPGIIDCHTHIATDGGINESGQAVTAEVRIGDRVDPDDITLYRHLAGGVTSANILHGSANPVGGQNQVIKFRWGAGAEELKFKDAPLGIKFALGENVKQSNWVRSTGRYPQTRMGVDELMIDEFRAAQAYRGRWRRWERDRRGLPPRRDLELDAVVEILEHKRWIHCHSYKQSEILAILRTLESFNLRIGSLQHILEGYKLAPEMVAHGAMGSSFSDWWAYKYEVYDAIPHNGSLMHDAGVVVSFNSDDKEMGRRLNQEAAKAVKYGRTPPEEALKFVTLNAAKQLRIEDRVGSLEPGKDADLAIWSGEPLSTYSRCEQTWVDGRRYFDRKQDERLRKRDQKLRAELVQAVLNGGEPPAKPGENRKDPSADWPRYDEYCSQSGGKEE